LGGGRNIKKKSFPSTGLKSNDRKNSRRKGKTTATTQRRILMMPSSHPNLWEAGNSQRECKYLCSTQKKKHTQHMSTPPLKKIFTLFFISTGLRTRGSSPNESCTG
jgi:hypothetical protein